MPAGGQGPVQLGHAAPARYPSPGRPLGAQRKGAGWAGVSLSLVCLADLAISFYSEKKAGLF